MCFVALDMVSKFEPQYTHRNRLFTFTLLCLQVKHPLLVLRCLIWSGPCTGRRLDLEAPWVEFDA